jgi:hypothetical protein
MSVAQAPEDHTTCTMPPPFPLNQHTCFSNKIQKDDKEQGFRRTSSTKSHTRLASANEWV